MFFLKFKYADSDGNIHVKKLDIGNVTAFSNSYMPKNIKQAIPTQPVQNTFVMNTGVIRTFSINFTRICHDNSKEHDELVDDDESVPTTLSTAWSNGFWMYIVRRFLVNRWQAETDGCKMVYISPDEQIYPSVEETNVYITGFVPTQKAGETYTLSGTLKLTVGATDISKITAKHTVVYHSNYVGNKGTYTGAESNIVKVWDSEDEMPIMAIPVGWLDTAFNEGIITNVEQARAYSVWCTEPSGIGGTTYPQTENIEFDDEDGILNLYAIYKESSE